MFARPAAPVPSGKFGRQENLADPDEIVVDSGGTFQARIVDEKMDLPEILRAGYASGCFQKIPPAAPDSNRRMPSERLDNGLHKDLLPSLRRNNEFLVRLDPSQQRSE